MPANGRWDLIRRLKVNVRYWHSADTPIRKRLAVSRIPRT